MCIKLIICIIYFYFQSIDINSFSKIDLESNKETNGFNNINTDDDEFSVLDINETPKRKKKRRKRSKKNANDIGNIYEFS